MGLSTEENFPRGGSKRHISTKPQQKPFKLFGVKQKIKKKSKKNLVGKKKQSADQIFNLDPSNQLTAISAELLKFTTVQEGMVVLGCIRDVRRMEITVWLPGRVSGVVPITHISKTYTKLLQSLVEHNQAPDEYQALSRLFQPGQYVNCKIMEIVRATDCEFLKLTLSLAPHDVQTNWKLSQLTVNTVLTAAVVSIEDHGYVMDTGINNCTAFLPKASTKQQFELGAVTFCCIQKTNYTGIGNKLVLSRGDEIYSKLVEDAQSLHDILPAMKVVLTVDKILPDGIQGTFLNNFIGYINDSHLAKAVYRVGEVVEARVLYVMPTSNLTYLTLRNIEQTPAPVLRPGHITSAEVTAMTGKGLFVRLSETGNGYVSMKRLKSSFSGEVDRLFACYPIGSVHKCRVLEYNAMDNLYICTCQSELITEKYFTLEDLTVGQLVQVTVLKLLAKGLLVTIGRLTGFVDSLHLSDIPFQNITLHKKFRIGQQLNARILTVNPTLGNLHLTLKPSLVECCLPCLSSYEQELPNQQLSGVVIQITSKGLLVLFYANVRGWLPNAGDKLEQLYYVGQVIKCYVVKSNPTDEKMILSLEDAQKKTRSVQSVQIGERVRGTVAKVTPVGIEVNMSNRGIGFLPTLHLSDNVNLSPLLLEKYQEGANINKLMCVAVTDEHIYLSKRETDAFKDQVPHFKSIRKGQLLRCTFKAATNKGLLLHSPIVDYQNCVVVPRNLIADDATADQNLRKLTKGHPLIAKVTNIDKKKRLVIAATKLSQCWDPSSQVEAVSLLSSYLRNVDVIRKMWMNAKKPLGLLKPAQTIEAKVKSMSTTKGCVLSLSTGGHALVPIEHCPSSVAVEENVSGIVLWLDYPNNSAIVTLLPKFRGIEMFDIPVGEIVEAEICLVEADFMLACTCVDGKKTLVCVPVRKHLNHFHLDHFHQYPIGAPVQLTIFRVDRSVFCIGLIVKTKQSEQQVSKQTTSTRKRSSSENSNQLPKKKKGKMYNENEQSFQSDTLLPGADTFWNLEMRKMFSTTDANQDSDSDSTSNTVITEKEQSNVSNSKKLSIKDRLEVARQDEERLRKIENELVDENVEPTNADQFDRLVLSQPDNSRAWISYMAFHLQATEIEKARSIARKALNTISFRQEQDKLNIWIALLNLENRFGTKEEFNTVLQEAARVNDSKTVHLRAIHILAESGKHIDFNDLLNIVLRKHKHSSDTWYQSASACYKFGLQDKARHLLQRALTTLEKKYHVDLIVQFAHLEIKYGTEERAQSLFEQVLGSYPKRVDIWCSYVDVLIKTDHVDLARKVLERAVSLRLSARKMKTLFKKFIDFEKTHGDNVGVDRIRQSAFKYVESATR